MQWTVTHSEQRTKIRRESRRGRKEEEERRESNASAFPEMIPYDLENEEERRREDILSPASSPSAFAAAKCTFAVTSVAKANEKE